MDRLYSRLIRLMFFSIFVISFFSMFGTASAEWHAIMTEYFDNNAVNWTWYQPPVGNPYSQQWHVRPWQTRDSLPDKHWGSCAAEAWCDASNDPTHGGAYRNPQINSYRTNMNTVMWWGPINSSNVGYVRCQFEWWNHTAPGDTLFWEVATDTNNPIGTGYRAHWFTGIHREPLYNNSGVYLRDTLVHSWNSGTANLTWRSGVISIDSLDSAGTIISLVGRPQIWFGWRFKSDSIFDSLPGATIGSLQISINDGLFDFNAEYGSHLRARDSVYFVPQFGDTARFKLNFVLDGIGILRNGSGQPVTARTRCYVNGVPFWDSVAVVDAGTGGTPALRASEWFLDLHLSFYLSADSPEGGTEPGPAPGFYHPGRKRFLRTHP